MFVDNLLVQIYFIIEKMWWTGLAPWKLEFPVSDSLASTFLVAFFQLLSAASQRRPMPPLPLPRPHGQPPKSLRAVAPIDPSKSSQPPRHPHENRPNPACCPATPQSIAPPGAHYNLSPHPRSPRAASALEKSSTFTRSARRICDPRAIRLLHPCYNLRGALANPQEESPRTRNILSTPSLVPLPIPRGKRPEPGI